MEYETCSRQPRRSKVRHCEKEVKIDTVVAIKPCYFLFPSRLRKRNVCSPLLVNFSVYSGHHVEDFRKRAPLASTLVERWYIAPGVQRIDVREKGVRATLFIPPGIVPTY